MTDKFRTIEDCKERSTMCFKNLNGRLTRIEVAIYTLFVTIVGTAFALMR